MDAQNRPVLARTAIVRVLRIEEENIRRLLLGE
jgi:hypothetical protein